MHPVSCLICRSQENRLLFTSCDKWSGRNGSYRLVECTRCGLVYINPQPEKEEVYASFNENYPLYQRALGKVSASPTASIRPFLRSARELSHRLGRRGEVLDIGCGDGYFLKAMEMMGWKGVGIDMNPYVCSYGEQKLGLEMYCFDFNEGSLPDRGRAFDLITMWGMLQTNPDPLATLKKAVTLLKKGGTIAIRITNVQSLEARLCGQDWWGWDVPRHLYQFSHKTLHRLMELAGLKTIDFHYSVSLWPFCQNVSVLLGKKNQHIWFSRMVKLAAVAMIYPWLFLLKGTNLGTFMTIHVQEK